MKSFLIQDLFALLKAMKQNKGKKKTKQTVLVSKTIWWSFNSTKSIFLLILVEFLEIKLGKNIHSNKLINLNKS